MEMAAAADRLPIEQVASRWIVATTPEEVLAQVRPYVEAGFDHLVFHAPGHDQTEGLRFAIHVGPERAPLDLHDAIDRIDDDTAHPRGQRGGHVAALLGAQGRGAVPRAGGRV